MKLDIARLKNDLKCTADELQEIKRLFREPNQPRVHLALYQRRRALRQKATMLCSIRAHHRNKIHLRGFSDLNAQLAFIQSEVSVYVLIQAVE
jgi:hypothetical protein